MNTVPAGSSFWTAERHANEDKAQYHARLRKQREHAKRVITGTRKIDPATLGKPLSSTDRVRAAARATRPAPTQPKFAKTRTRKQHQHPLRDQHGAYVLVGQPPYAADAINPNRGRRIWLAGISAQRGY